MEAAVVYLRHDGKLLYWEEQPSVPVGTRGETPAETASRTLRERGLDSDSLERVRRGDPFDVADPSALDEATADSQSQRPLTVHPFLFECPVLPSDGRPSSPAELSDNPVLWRGYDRVRPTVETITADTTHGSATLSVRALEVLRGEAVALTRGESEFDTPAEVAAALVAARPTMTALANRVCRALDASENRRAETVADAAHVAIDRALSADKQAAATAAERVAGKRVATLSRSGTVLSALTDGEPTAVLVAESRPGGEGLAVADDLADSVETTLTSDAAFPNQLGEWDADILLVGADAVLSDGRVVNKVGTLGATLGAAHHGAEVVVVTASDKIAPEDSFDPERRNGRFSRVSTAVTCHDPTFEAIGPDCYDVLLTERGVFDREQVREHAEEAMRVRSLLAE